MDAPLNFWWSFELPEGRYYACGLCGAVVEDDNMERHRKWHVSLLPTPAPVAAVGSSSPVGGEQ